MTPGERPDRRAVNIPVALLSLFTSTVLWLVVFVNKLPADVTKVLYVPVSISGLDSERFVISKKEDRLQVILRGPDLRVRDLDDRDVEAVADLSKAIEGTHSYPVSLFTQNQSIKSMLASSDYTTRVGIESLARKEFPVTADSRGELDDTNYVLSETLVEPPKVRIYGPKSEVSRVRTVRAVIDLGAIKGSRSSPSPVGLEFLDNAGRPLVEVRSEPIAVTVTPILSLAPQEKTVFIRPAITGRPAIGFSSVNYAVEPNQVTVRGPSRLVARVSQLETDPISLSGLQGTRTYVARLRIPEGLTCTARQVSVTVYVKLNPKVEPPNQPSTQPPPPSVGASPR